MALKVADLDGLKALFARVSTGPGVVVEFAPEPLGEGPKTHCMIYEPSGLRIEFVCLARIL